MSINFSEVDTPLDIEPDFLDGEAVKGVKDSSDDVRHCRSCGIELPPVTGRGRKPTLCEDCKSAPKSVPSAPASAPSRGSNADVTKALATMDMFYQAIASTATLFLGPVGADIREKIPVAQMLNKSAFEADRKLARRVGSVGGNTGAIAFVAAQAMIATPIVAAVKERPRKDKPVKTRPPKSSEAAPPPAPAASEFPPGF